MLPSWNAKYPVAGLRRHAGRPVIGATSQVIRTSKWYKAASQLGFAALEVNRRNSRLHLNTFFLEKVRRYLSGLDLSIHSSTTGLFQELESFSQAELATLQAEVDIGRILGAGELIFHINVARLDERKGRLLEPVIAYALDSGVLPVFESDAGLNARQALQVLEMFPDLGYALDLGHLNNGWGRNLLGCPMDTFIEKVKHRTVYIHANNNDGLKDQHHGLDQGSLDWRAVLDRFDLGRIRKIIVEVCAAAHLDPSRRALQHYLDARTRGLARPRQIQGLNAQACRPYVNDIQGAISLPDGKQIFQGHTHQAAEQNADDPGMGHDEGFAAQSTNHRLESRPHPVEQIAK
jgi:sugar phosphate isomerase/epimerase